MCGTRPENAPEPKELFARAKAGYSREDSRRVPVDMVCTLRAGEPVSLTASAGGHVVRAEGPTPVSYTHLLRQIEKEGYYWARQGLFDQDSAARYLKTWRDRQQGQSAYKMCIRDRLGNVCGR